METMEQNIEKSAPAPKSNWRINILPAAIAAILLAVSSPAVFQAVSIYTKGLIATQYKMIDARVVNLVDDFQPFGVHKQALMAFNIEGKEETALATIPSGRVMKKGESTVVFCDPKTPKDAVLTQEIDYDSVILLGGYGLFIFCFGAFILKRAIRKSA